MDTAKTFKEYLTELPYITFDRQVPTNVNGESRVELQHDVFDLEYEKYIQTKELIKKGGYENWCRRITMIVNGSMAVCKKHDLCFTLKSPYDRLSFLLAVREDSTIYFCLAGHEIEGLGKFVSSFYKFLDNLIYRKNVGGDNYYLKPIEEIHTPVDELRKRLESSESKTQGNEIERKT